MVGKTNWKPEVGPIMTPSEHHISLPIRVTRNCHWNRCLFCPVYKDKEFSQRSVEKIKKDIDFWASQSEGSFKSVFLQDSDPLVTRTEDLLEILEYIDKEMPNIKRITCYARASTVYRKTPSELKAMHQLGLSSVYIGFESGYNKLLKYMKKGLSKKVAIKAGLKAKESGLKLNFFVLLGLAGRLVFDNKEAWIDHALETSKVLNTINPEYIRFRTLYIGDKEPYKTPLTDCVKAGEFEEASGQEVLREQILLIKNLDVTSRIECRFISNYFNLPYDYVFPRDKKSMIRQIKRALEIPGFIEKREKRAKFRKL